MKNTDQSKIRKQVIVDKDGREVTFTFENNKMIRSDIKYPKGYKSLQEELEEHNKTAPKSRQKFLADDGKIIGYYTAVKRGLV